jgi:hypothetical protein
MHAREALTILKDRSAAALVTRVSSGLSAWVRVRVPSSFSEAMLSCLMTVWVGTGSLVPAMFCLRQSVVVRLRRITTASVCLYSRSHRHHRPRAISARHARVARRSTPATLPRVCTRSELASAQHVGDAVRELEIVGRLGTSITLQAKQAPE